MNSPDKKSGEALGGITSYRFEFRHLTILFVVLIFFQIVLSLIQKSYIEDYLLESQNRYRRESAESLAFLTCTSFELLLENVTFEDILDESEGRKLIRSFNIIFSQHLLQHNVDETFLVLETHGRQFVVDDGNQLYNFLSGDIVQASGDRHEHKRAMDIYQSNIEVIREREQVYSEIENGRSFHVFVPFMPNGEYLGVLYMKRTPDFSQIVAEIISSYDESTLVYSALILIGLLAMYYISSFTVRERDQAQKLLMKEHEHHLKQQIMHEKESLFTKRIYHTHHKAEKVMGYIKEDLRHLSHKTIDDIKYRVTRYANFISRVIYDMKWYDQPLQTIRNPIFNTDLNEVISFIIDHIFLRITSQSEMYEFKLALDNTFPKVHINEFVIWEIIEPLIQNSIDYAPDRKITISITTSWNEEENAGTLTIADTGNGIADNLLETNEHGVQIIFLENVTTKFSNDSNSGYGCYIAYQLAVKRCGWKINARNSEDGGAVFELLIKKD